MALAASCPRCPAPVSDEGGRTLCDVHGPVEALLSPALVDYQHWTEVLQVARMPLYLPWPLSPGWQVAHFAVVPGHATITSLVGESPVDGAVSVRVIAEEPGIGVGQRCCGITDAEVLGQLGGTAPAAQVQVAGRSVPLWSLSPGPGTGDDQQEPLAEARFVGEAQGRWLWLCLRPASAAMLLHRTWLLVDAAQLGPQALTLPFGGQAPDW